MAEQKSYSIKIDGIEQSIKGVESLGTNVTKTGNAWKDTQKALKEVKAEMAGLDKNSAQWKELAKVAGDYKDRLDDINQAARRFASDTKALDDAINIGQSMTSVFTLAKGAMSAFGLETEGAVEAIQKLQGAMAIIQSLQSLQNTLRGSTATTDMLTKSMKLLGIGMNGVSTTSKVLRVALASIGIGLIIGLVMTLIEYWDDIKKSFTDTFPILKTLSDKFNGLSGVIKGVGQAIVHWLTNPIVTFAKVLKKLFAGDFKGAIAEAMNGIKNQFTGLKDAFFKGIESSRQKVEKESDKASKSVIKKGKDTAEELKKIQEKMLSDWVKAERKAEDEVQKYRDEAVDKEKKRLEKLKSLRDKDQDAEYKYHKAVLEAAIEDEKNEKEKIKLKEKLLDLETKIAKENAIASAAEQMGLSTTELQQRLEMTDEKWIGLNEEQKQVLQTLITQLATIEAAADTTKKKLNDTGSGKKTSGGSSQKNENGEWKKWSELSDDEREERTQVITQASIDLAQEAFATITDGFMQMMDFEIEEAQEALDEVIEMHDEQVEKVNESQERIAELNDKMREASGAQLEQYKQQMADEMLLLQDREMEERRLQKEKEKREKELEKKEKKRRKDEAAAQIIDAAINIALAVTKAMTTFPPPASFVMAGLTSALGLAQLAIMTKNYQKMADGGLLQGKSHAQGGIPVGNTGIEVEGGEYVINKRSTAKYLPLLQQLNEEGARKKTVANQIGKMADGGELNYERINSNMDALNTAKMVSSAIEGIEMHPVVSVVDINRGQRNYTEVRQLAGANT